METPEAVDAIKETPDEHRPGRAGVVFDALDVLAVVGVIVLSIFGLIDLLPRWGWPLLLVAGLGFFYHWVRDADRRHRVCANVRAGTSAIFKSHRDWLGLAFALLLILASGLCVLFNWLQFNWGRQSYLSEHNALEFAPPALAADRYPSHSVDVKAGRAKQELAMNHWRRWLSDGIPGAGLATATVSLETKPFENDYGDFEATLLIDARYKINEYVAFLESTEPAFLNDPTYRPVLRQLDGELLQGANGLEIDIEVPEKNERLVVLLQVERKDGTIFKMNECFINTHMGVDK